MASSKKVKNLQVTGSDYTDRSLLLVNPGPGQREEIIAGLVRHGIANAATRVYTLPMDPKLQKLGRSVLLRVWFTGNNWPEFNEDFQKSTRTSRPVVQIVVDLNDHEVHIIGCLPSTNSEVISLVLDDSASPILEGQPPERVIVSGSISELINVAANLMSRKVYVP